MLYWKHMNESLQYVQITVVSCLTCALVHLEYVCLSKLFTTVVNSLLRHTYSKCTNAHVRQLTTVIKYTISVSHLKRKCKSLDTCYSSAYARVSLVTSSALQSRK